MKLVTYQSERGARLGALLDDGAVLDLADAARSTGAVLPADMQLLIEQGPKGWDLARDVIEVAPDEAVRRDARLLSPLARPVRFRDCSLFLEHMEVALAKIARERREVAPEGKFLPPAYKNSVIYYNADNLHIYGPDDEIIWPAHSRWMDYELEWACVIGKSGRDIGLASAAAHIFGFTIFNDWSARDLQIPFMSAGLGPAGGKDFANSLGPCIATPDEFADPYRTGMTARVNGETWSRGSTASMHHSWEDAIVAFSRGNSIVAGEVFGSGTVLGGCGYELDRQLADGDVVELEVEHIGTLRNQVRRV